MNFNQWLYDSLLVLRTLVPQNVDWLYWSMTKSEWAAWVSAVGGLLSAFAVIVTLWWQIRQQKRIDKERLNERNQIYLEREEERVRVDILKRRQIIRFLQNHDGLEQSISRFISEFSYLKEDCDRDYGSIWENIGSILTAFDILKKRYHEYLPKIDVLDFQNANILSDNEYYYKIEDLVNDYKFLSKFFIEEDSNEEIIKSLSEDIRSGVLNKIIIDPDVEDRKIQYNGCLMGWRYFSRLMKDYEKKFNLFKESIKIY